MLEDMEVGIADLQRVVFQITEAKTDDLNDLEPLVCGSRWDVFLLFWFLVFVHDFLFDCVGVLDCAYFFYKGWKKLFDNVITNTLNISDLFPINPPSKTGNHSDLTWVAWSKRKASACQYLLR